MAAVGTRLRASLSAHEARLPADKARQLLEQLRQAKAQESSVPLTAAQCRQRMRQALFQAHHHSDKAGSREVAAQQLLAAPGLYASLRRVLHELQQRAGDRLPTIAESPLRILDVGSSWGAGTLAAQHTWTDASFACALYDTWLQRAQAASQWLDARPQLVPRMGGDGEGAASRYDVVIAAHTFAGGVAAMHPSTWAWRLWQCTGRFLVVLEPGTVEGFAHVVATRDALLRRPDGDDAEDAVIARMIAPCPHSGACPLMAGPDGSKGDGSAASGCVSFCHFAQRYERDRLLQQYRRVDRERQLVNTSARNISNRRFSYVILERPSTESPPSSAAAAVAASRVVMAPQKRGGHVILPLCCSDGHVARHIVARSDGERHGYARARRAAWGELWPFPLPHRGRMR
ncbi:hypothetical protein CDCA_CDCA15G4019 [Cyanidium caldarium]|uniref:Methyltransferase n=1 Tax=Cyanidium caldarium TaxID=2771 RepID=A0AAV9J109_CYACA|nr:hypothetical protein CDCA_CDCA15G4019 [Cyanidium caldarium]